MDKERRTRQSQTHHVRARIAWLKLHVSRFEKAEGLRAKRMVGAWRAELAERRSQLVRLAAGQSLSWGEVDNGIDVPLLLRYNVAVMGEKVAEWR